MASKTKHFPSFSIVNGDVQIKVDLSRFERQFRDAQFALDSAIMTSMVPFMPMEAGNFIQRTRMISASMAGTGTVCAAAPPMGRFLYEGKVMVDSETGRGAFPIENSPGEIIFRFRKGAKLVATDKALNYFKGANPQVTDHWFDKAKKQDLKQWVSLVKKTAGGGAVG